MPSASSESNNRFFEIDSDRLDLFDSENNGFIKFIGALFADSQTFFIRTKSMNKGEILFCFSLLLEQLTPQEILSHPSHANWFVPFETEPSIYNVDIFNELQTQWSRIMASLKTHSLYSLARKPSSYASWLLYYELSRIAQFSSLGGN